MCVMVTVRYVCVCVCVFCVAVGTKKKRMAVARPARRRGRVPAAGFSRRPLFSPRGSFSTIHSSSSAPIQDTDQSTVAPLAIARPNPIHATAHKKPNRTFTQHPRPVAPPRGGARAHAAMFSAIGEALTNLIPTPIKRLFDGVAGGGGGNGGNGSGRKHQRRRQDGSDDDQQGPVIQPARGFAGIAHGGTQGLGWYKRTMVRAGGGSAGGGAYHDGDDGDCDRAHGHFDADECEARHDADKARREAGGG